MRILLIIVTGAILALVFFLWTFPYATLEKRLEYAIAQRSNLRVEGNGLGYAFPFGLCLKSTSVSLADAALPSEITVNTPCFQLHPLRLLWQELSTTATCTLFGGQVSIQTEFFPLPSIPSFATTCQAQDLNLSVFNVGEKLQTVQDLQGRLAGHMDLSGDWGDLLQSTGQGSLQLTKGAVLVMASGQTLSFTDLRGNGQVQLKGRTLTITQGTLKATGADLDIKGSIDLKPDLGQSRVRLRGSVRLSGANPQAYSLARDLAGRSQITFALYGPLSGPRYKIMNALPNKTP